jgi:phosphatidylinositol alpha-mannosyltransferase
VRRRALSAAGREAAASYDWQVVARRVLAVYETVATPGGDVVTVDDGDVAAVTGAGGLVRVLPALRRRVRR